MPFVHICLHYVYTKKMEIANPGQGLYIEAGAHLYVKYNIPPSVATARPRVCAASLSYIASVFHTLSMIII